MQVADVNKVLASVGKMTDADNTIIFSKRRSVITSDPTGEIAEAAIKRSNPNFTTELEKKNGVYSFDMWIPATGNSGGEGKQEEETIHAIDEWDFTWLEDEVM